MKTINKRRSIRSYKSTSVEDKKIEMILRAGMQAPSAGNQRPWEFIVVRDKAILEKLSAMSKYSKMIASAPVAIVLVADESRMIFKENWEQDMGACTQNILLEIVEQGLGGVWLGVAPLEERMTYVREALKIEKIPFAIVPFGYSEKENEFVDRFDEERISYID